MYLEIFAKIFWVIIFCNILHLWKGFSNVQISTWNVDLFKQLQWRDSKRRSWSNNETIGTTSSAERDAIPQTAHSDIIGCILRDTTWALHHFPIGSRLKVEQNFLEANWKSFSIDFLNCDSRSIFSYLSGSSGDPWPSVAQKAPFVLSPPTLAMEVRVWTRFPDSNLPSPTLLDVGISVHLFAWTSKPYCSRSDYMISHWPPMTNSPMTHPCRFLHSCLSSPQNVSC